MEVIVIEHEAFKRLEAMFTASQETIQMLTKKVGQKDVWMNVGEVSVLTGYHEKTIKLRKEEIGYRTTGKDLFFKQSDVEAWMEKYYRSPALR